MATSTQLQLAQAVEGAQGLLRYACAKGMTVPGDVMKAIIESKKLLGLDDADAQTYADQQQFWDALTKLTALTAPATIDSVSYTQVTDAGWIAHLRSFITRRPIILSSVTQRAVRWAAIIAAVALLVVGALQLAADVGSAAVQNYATNKLKYETNHRLLQAVPPQPETEADARLRAENAQLLDASTQELAAMDLWLGKLPFVPGFKASPGTPEHSQELIVRTQLVLTVLRGFFLPILWGVLGASLYVCRTLADDISKMAYSAEHRMLHLSRYFLGAVGGFVVAKFSVALSGKSLDDVVQPYVLALLVGYSVDVLFSMFDKLISTFSNR